MKEYFITYTAYWGKRFASGGGFTLESRYSSLKLVLAQAKRQLVKTIPKGSSLKSISAEVMEMR